MKTSKSPRRGGFSARGSLDMSLLREAAKGPGIDTRYWVSHATVGTVDDDGNPDFTDWHAIHIAPRGVTVDVVLQPLNMPVTCRYIGIQGGKSATMYAPIHPGDQVLVFFPDGDFVHPVIAAILNSSADPMPVDQGDQKPHFRNDRVLLFSNDVPIDIRTAGGARAVLKQDGNVVVEPGQSGKVMLGGDSGLEAATLGDTLQSFIDTLISTFNAHTHTGGTLGGGLTGPPNPPPLPTPSPVVTAQKVEVK